MSTFDGNGCTYDGPAEFELDSEVTFTFINASEVSSDSLGFAVWPLPAGTTTNEIRDDGIFNVGAAGPDEGAEARVSDSESQLTLTLDKTGLHALNCFDMTTGGEGVDYPTLITVSE